jgi:hypothetical protein
MEYQNRNQRVYHQLKCDVLFMEYIQRVHVKSVWAVVLIQRSCCVAEFIPLLISNLVKIKGFLKVVIKNPRPVDHLFLSRPLQNQ